MANPQHVEILNRGVYLWNEWRRENPDVIPDLRSAYLREAQLRDYDLRRVDLRAATLLGASIEDSDCSGADFSFADLRFVETRGAKLTQARFHEARGVTDEMHRAAKPPSKLWLFTKKAAPVALGTALLWAGYLQYGERARAVVETVWGALPAFDSSEAAAEAPAGPEDELAMLIAQLDFGEWRLVSARAVADSLILRVDVPLVTGEIYVAAVGAVCGALKSSPTVLDVREIRVTNRIGDRGWAFQNARACEALLKAPPAVMRLALMAESRVVSKPRPGRD